MSATYGATPCPGDVVLLGPRASERFAGPVRYQVTGVRPALRVSGWVYLRGYLLTSTGIGEPDEVFVDLSGVVIVDPS